MAKSSSGWSWAWIHGWSHKGDVRIKRENVNVNRDQRIVEWCNRTFGERLFTFQYSQEMNFKKEKRSTEWVKRLQAVVFALNCEETRFTGKKTCRRNQRQVGWRKECEISLCCWWTWRWSRRATDPIWYLKVVNIDRTLTVLHYMKDWPKCGFVRKELQIFPPETELPPEETRWLGKKTFKNEFLNRPKAWRGQPESGRIVEPGLPSNPDESGVILFSFTKTLFLQKNKSRQAPKGGRPRSGTPRLLCKEGGQPESGRIVEPGLPSNPDESGVILFSFTKTLFLQKNKSRQAPKGGRPRSGTPRLLCEKIQHCYLKLFIKTIDILMTRKENRLRESFL